MMKPFLLPFFYFLFYLYSISLNCSANEILYVNSEKELKSAIGSNRTIVVNINQIIIKESIFINGIKNLKIIGATIPYSQIFITDAAAAVFLISNSNNIQFSGIEAGHHEIKGICSGGVLLFENCTDIKIDNCILFGCGVDGIHANNVIKFDVKNTKIHKCSFQLMTIFNVQEAIFTDCIFLGNQTDSIAGRIVLNGCSSLKFIKCSFKNNSSVNPLFFHVGQTDEELKCTNLHFSNCNIEQNKNQSFSNIAIEKILILKSVFRKNNFSIKLKK